METIISLLFILLPVIFNLIGKRLEQSGKTDKAGKLREIAKTPDAGPEPVREQVVQTRESNLPTGKVADRATTKPKNVTAKPSVNPRKNRIDPKKLVIYSEIMKPKYTE